MKTVKSKLQETGQGDDVVKAFESGAQKFVKEKLLPNFKDFEFYTGESMNPDGMVALLNYRYVSLFLCYMMVFSNVLTPGLVRMV